jgi:DNA transformation protein and related proteins
MSANDGTFAFIRDALAPMGRITVRRMFGGAGIYCDGVIFGLFLRDALYLKADAASIPDFEAEGMPAFSYETKHGDRSLTTYWRAPERLFDEPDEFVAWARRALAVSLAKPVPERKAVRKRRSGA